MDFFILKGSVTNKGEEDCMKKDIPEEDIKSLQDLMIDKDNMNKGERPNNILGQMVQYLCQKYELSLKNDLRLKKEGVMEEKDDGQVEYPPNF